MFLYEITHRYLKNRYQFFDTLKAKDRKIRGNCNLLIKVKFSNYLIIIIYFMHFKDFDFICKSFLL